MSQPTRHLIIKLSLCLVLALALSSGATPAQAANPNLIQNPGVETNAAKLGTPLLWYKGGYGTNDRVLTFPVAGHSGAKAMRTEIATYTNGDAKWYNENVPVTPGQTYVYSEWYRANAPTSVTVRYQLTDGTFEYPYLATTLPASTSWTSFAKTFAIPTTFHAPVQYFSVFHLIKQVGWVETDDFSLALTDDTAAPTVAVGAVSPQPASGVVTLNATASDDRGVVGVQFAVDGAPLGAEDATAPYTAAWDTAQSGDGSHAITAVARDAAGNAKTAQAVNVTVLNHAFATLVVKKTVINDDGGHAVPSDFSVHVTGPEGLEVDGGTFPGVAAGTTLYVSPGDYHVGSTRLNYYDRSKFGDCDSRGDLSLSAGETKTCVVQDDDAQRPETGRLVITVNVVNNDGGKKTVADFPLFINEANADSGASNVLDAGAYVVSTIADPGYDVAVTGACAADGSVTVGAGQNLNCVVTADDITPAPPLPSGNLVPNPSLEIAIKSGTAPTDWGRGGTGANTRVLTYPVAGYDGAKAAKTEVTAYTDGDAKWYFPPVAVVPGSQYSFTEYYTSNAPTTSTVQYTLANGTTKYANFNDVIPKATTWTKLSRTFVVPTNLPSPVVKATVFHLLKQVGWLSIDQVALTEFMPPAADPDNLIVNPSVEYLSGTSSTKPAAWSYSTSTGATSAFSYPSIPGQNGQYALKVSITDYTGGAGARWYFQNVPVTPGEDYAYSDWYKSDVDSSFSAQFTLDDGTFKYLDLRRLSPAAAWTQASATFTAPAHAVSVTIPHVLQSVGSLTTDNYSLKKLPSAKFDAGMVTFTFDDGPVSAYDNGMPKMRAAGLKSTQAIITQDAGTPYYMDWIQIGALAAQGDEIGAHTRTHAHLPTLDAAGLADEIAGSKADLAAQGYDAQTFVYPYGEYNDTVEAAVQAAGFRGARSVREGFNTKNTDPFALYDLHAQLNVPFSRYDAAVDQAVADKTWLILELHDIDHSGDPYSITPEMLQQIIDKVVGSGIKVVTLGEGLAAMGH